MPNSDKSGVNRRLWRRWWKPVAATGVGGAAVAVWIDEILVFAEEIIGLLLLPIMAGAIYLLDILMFRSRMPRPDDDDLENPRDKGARL